MSHIDFASFKAERPDLGQVWDALQHWRERFPTRQYMDVREVVAPSRGVTPDAMLAAVEFLLESGAVRQVYRVLDPVQHVPVGEEFDSPLKVPDRVRGRFDEWVDTAEAEIVPLLKEA